ncbi:MAG: Holliday junction resolvase-like protein [Nanoarchaeota archaeon]
METEEIIKLLKESDIYAEHSACDSEFKISDALLFDGTKPFPFKAAEVQKNLEEGLKKRQEELKKSLKRATTGAQTTAKSTNVGKLLEKVFPTMNDFKWELSDCRFLGDPIDIVIFHGLTAGKVESIRFLEVKSGKAVLNKHQKSIKEAVENNKVKYEEFK